MRQSLTLVALLLAPAAVAASPRFVDYIYIEANEGGSSGGHAAIRFGDETYHFQHERPGLLRLRRDDSQHFRYAYGVLDNRSMHVSRITVSDETYSRLRRAFGERYLIERKRFDYQDVLREDRALLELLLARRQDGTSGSIRLRGAGFFLPDDRGPRPAVPDLGLHRRVEEVYGPDGIRRRTEEVQDELAHLAPAAPESPDGAAAGRALFTYPFSVRYRDLATALVALQVLDHALPLRPESRWPAADADLELDGTEQQALAAFADRLTDELVRLLRSDRPDWGFALLVGMARLAALRESVETGRLVLLDAFPPAAAVISRSYVRQHRDAVSHMLADARDDFARARGRLRTADEIREADFAELEDAGNRMLELDGAITRQRDLRLWPGFLQPSRDAALSDLIVPDVLTRELAGALTRARAAEKVFASQLDHDYRYDLLTRNCVSEIFRTVDSAGAEPGGHVDTGWSLGFIPFVSARAVNDEWDVAERTVVPSYRSARLQEVYRRGNRLGTWLRECNVLTSAIYRRNPDDSFFLFFTDDVIAPRPVFGAVNLIAGLGAGAAGVALLPVDHGHTLMAGLRGALFSLPELAFVNLRKGSFDYVPRDDRPVDAEGNIAADEPERPEFARRTP